MKQRIPSVAETMTEEGEIRFERDQAVKECDSLAAKNSELTQALESQYAKVNKLKVSLDDKGTERDELKSALDVAEKQRANARHDEQKPKHTQHPPQSFLSS